MFRVLHVIDGDRLEGGMEIFLGRLAPALRDAGLVQQVVTRRHPELADHLAGHGIPATRLSLAKRDPLSWLALRWLAWRFRPDFILSWLPHAARRVPAGPWLRVAQVGLYGSLRFNRGIDAMIVPAPDMVRHFSEAGFPKERIHILPHFTDDKTSPPQDRAAFATPPDAPVVVTCGRLYHLKGFDTALATIARLPGVYFWIAGAGEEEASLRALADRFGITDRVRFLGWQRDIPAILAAADIALIPSRHEPFGLVFLEAWRAGVPVVATASEGGQYLVRPGETGLLAPIDDDRTLAEHITAILSDPALRTRLATGGRARLDSDFTRTATAQAYLRFFEATRALPPLTHVQPRPTSWHLPANTNRVFP